LNGQELKAVWDACHDSNTDLPKPYRDIVRLLILSGQRRGEIAALRTSFIDGDLATLPGDVCKNGRQHTFPLPSLAQKLLGEVDIEEAYLISKAIGFSRYVAKLWSPHHIPGYRIS
jgi:integrase